jgi:hypothetical protein
MIMMQKNFVKNNREPYQMKIKSTLLLALIFACTTTNFFSQTIKPIINTVNSACNCPTQKIWDITFDTTGNHINSNFPEAWWTGAAPWSYYFNPGPNSKIGLISIAKLIGDLIKTGCPVRPFAQLPCLSTYSISPNEVTMLDFEDPYFKDSLLLVNELIDTVRAHAGPNAVLTHCSGPYHNGELFEGWGNQDNIISAANGDTLLFNLLKTHALKYISYINRLDAITVDAYMLGDTIINGTSLQARSLSYHRAIVNLLNRIFPGKPVYAIAWGAYHTVWNPPHVLLDSVRPGHVVNPNIRCDYITSLSDFDGLFIWGDYRPDNEWLAQMLEQKCLGVNNISQVQNNDKAVWIYPNPNNGIFTVDMPNENEGVLELYNLAGELIKKQQLSRGRQLVQLNDIAKGFYFVKIIDQQNRIYEEKISITN